MHTPHGKKTRRGTAAPLFAILIIPLAGVTAFAIDYGYLLRERADLQRAADAATLAAAQELAMHDDPDAAIAAARATVRHYVAANIGGSFAVSDSDIVIGRYDPDTIYSNLSILDSGDPDTVRVTLRRDGTANARVGLFFAPVMGVNSSSVAATSTAIIQKASSLAAGADVLPFAVSLDEWESMEEGDTWNLYGGGRVTDSNGNVAPGNWATVDIGLENNSTSDLSDQIIVGLRQKDLDALYAAGRISSNECIDVNETIYLNADPGVSSGMKSAVEQIHGQMRIIPIFLNLGDQNDNDQNGNGDDNDKDKDKSNNGKGNDKDIGGGNNLEYEIVAWGVIQVLDSSFHGSKDTYIQVRRGTGYSGGLAPQKDLSNTTGTIAGAFTSPVLVQ